MPGSRCKCHYQIIIPGHSFGPSPTSRLRELRHGIEVERQDLLSEVSPLAVISRIFLHLGDSIGILDAATDKEVGGLAGPTRNAVTRECMAIILLHGLRCGDVQSTRPFWY